MRQEFITIGRHPSADVRFDAGQDVEVSGRHAAIFWQQGAWVLRDLGSRNGTWLNGVRLTGDQALSSNDVIRFGPQGPELLFLARDQAAATIPATRPLPEASVTAPAERAEPARPGPVTERIRREVRRQTAPWRRATVGLAAAAVLVSVGVLGVLRQQRRALERERATLLARTDSLIAQLEATSSNVASLESALAQARREAQRLRGSLASGAGSQTRLDSLARELRSGQQRHTAVLRAARLDLAAIGRESGDAIALLLSEFPDGRRVAGTAFAVRSQGDTGWVVTSRHLVVDAAGRRASRLGVIFNGSSQNFRAEIAVLAESADLALLSVRVRAGVPVVRGIADTLAPGDAVAILGYPFGLEFPAVRDWRRVGVSVSTFTGSVRQVRADAIEVDSYGATGSSGSPLFGVSGLVSGVIYGGDPATAGRIVFAVPPSVLEGFLRQAGVR